MIAAAAAVAVLGAASGLGVSPAQAEDPTFVIKIKDHRFEPAEIEVPAGTRIKLTIHNDDATPEEFDSASLNREKVIRPGGQGQIFVGPLDSGRYEFIGEGHPETARGALIAR